MATSTVSQSFICTDVGSAFTRTCLIDYVEDRYRLVARAETPTCLDPQQKGIMGGVLETFRRLEVVAQRPLLADNDQLISPERIDGQGADEMLATISAVPAIDCVVIGLVPRISLASARRMCESRQAHVRRIVPLARAPGLWDDELLNELRQMPPDVVVFAGGVDGGPVDPLERAMSTLSELYTSVSREGRPTVIYAGNSDARRPISAAAAGRFDLHFVDNVCPMLDHESPDELQRELQDLYRERMRRLPGYDRLEAACALPPQITADCTEIIWRFLAERDSSAWNVLGIDAGSRTTHMALAAGDGCLSTILSTVGIGHSASHLLSAEAADTVVFSPLDIDAEEMAVYVRGAALRPHSVPQTERELHLTQGIVGRALRTAEAHLAKRMALNEDAMPQVNLVAYRGAALGQVARQDIVLLTLLDSLPLEGLVKLVYDWAGIWPQLGALAQRSPQAATETLLSDGIASLGTAFVPRGKVSWGHPALSIRLTRHNGEVVEREINAGTLHRFALDVGEKARLEVYPQRSLDIGLDKSGLSGRAEIRGGALGLIIDARGRPWEWPKHLSWPERRDIVGRWLEALCR